MAGDDMACQQEMEREPPHLFCALCLSLWFQLLSDSCVTPEAGELGGSGGGERVNATTGTHKLVTCACLRIDMLTVYDPTKHLPSLPQPLNAKTYFDIAQGFVN